MKLELLSVTGGTEGFHIVLRHQEPANFFSAVLCLIV